MQASFVPGDRANRLLHRSEERHARSAEYFRQHQRHALPDDIREAGRIGGHAHRGGELGPSPAHRPAHPCTSDISQGLPMSLILKSRWQSLIAATLAVIVCGPSALADDSEIFAGSSSSVAQPNILLILDTSCSMASTVTTQTPFNPNTTYPGACSGVYFQASGGSAPTTGCSGMSSFSTSYQKCQSGVNSLIDPGFYTDQFLQWKFKNPNKYSWANTIVSGASRWEVACQGDYSSTAPFPTTYNGPNNTAANEWTNTANGANSYWAQSGASGGGDTLYSANYPNYLAPNSPTVSGTRLSVVQQAATNL